MSTSGVRFARPRRPTAVVDSWARRTSKPSSGSSRACRHVSTGSVSVCGKHVAREDAADDDARPPGVSPTEPFVRREHGHLVPARCERRGRQPQRGVPSPACRSGNHWSMATRIRTASRPAFPPTRSSSRSVRRLPRVLLGQLRGGARPRRETRPRALPRSRRRTPPAPCARVTSGSMPAELGHSARDDGLARGEVLEDLERRAVPRVGVRPVRDQADREAGRRRPAARRRAGSRERGHCGSLDSRSSSRARILRRRARRGRSSTRAAARATASRRSKSTFSAVRLPAKPTTGAGSARSSGAAPFVCAKWAKSAPLRTRCVSGFRASWRS